MKFNMNPIVKPTTTKERVYNEIKKVILNGYISSKEVFTEVQLADSLNTSRTPVREALLDLMKEGLITSIPRKGMSIRKVTDKEIEQIFIVRASIESEVMKKLAETITEQQLKQLKISCDQQEKAMRDNDEVTFIHLDQQFHSTLIHLAGFELIEQILLSFHNLSQLIGLKAIKRNNRMQEVLQEHRKILSTLEQRNAEAAVQTMVEHLQRTKQSIG
ncbi:MULTISPECIES: GntR family transcriptional regulator [unclassified Paenibacillus]|uniref:GntR family transcriptional regulator n=1 Tax=unclassified Paenibacillus TaxID=185978 RepID=UPI0009ACE76F|nr:MULTISPECIES: GntR family transcriptional regulator [unclassified Paenibacillus]MBE1442347.1 DNA-binding GntR family transcriptional regulator [Paenibacillus sp. OAS669]